MSSSHPAFKCKTSTLIVGKHLTCVAISVAVFKDQFIHLDLSLRSLKIYTARTKLSITSIASSLLFVCLRNSDRSRAAGEVALNGNDLVVVSTKLKAEVSPSVKVRLGGDGSAAALGVSHRPVLLKGRGALDAGGVGAGGGRNLVRGAVRSDATLLRSGGRRVVCAEVLDD